MNRLNIYYRKDGRYEGRIYSTDTESGELRYRSFFGHSREEVADKMQAHRIKNVAVPSVDLSFSELYSEWESTNRHRIKEATAANYRLKAEKHILPVFGNIFVSEISTEQIYHFISQKQEQQLSNRYISDILVMMRSIFKLRTQRYHLNDPMSGIIMPKKCKSEVQLLTLEQQRRLEQYINQNHSLTTLGIALTKATGLRIGKLCALQWEDIDLEKCILTVRKTIQRIQCKNGCRKTKLIITDPKSESSCRVIPIPEFLINFLREFRGNDDDYVISGKKKPVEPRTMQYRFAKILKNGNLPSVHFHSLRHRNPPKRN